MRQAFPLISVIIPTRNRRAALLKALEALSRQRLSKDTFEVILVNDGGDSIKDLERTFRQVLTLKTFDLSWGGPGKTRNFGARAATSPFIAFTDDDCTAHPDWLCELLKAYSKNPHSGVGGSTLNLLANNSLSAFSHCVSDMVHAYHNPAMGEASFFASNNVSFPKALFLQLGGFSGDMEWAGGEDRELCDRWLFSGNRLLSAPEAIVQHAHPLNLWKFLDMHFRYGKGACRYDQIRKTRGSGEVRGKVGFHRSLPRLWREVGERTWDRGLFLAGALFLILQLANAFGYACVKAKRFKSHHPYCILFI